MKKCLTVAKGHAQLQKQACYNHLKTFYVIRVTFLEIKSLKAVEGSSSYPVIMAQTIGLGKL